MKKWVLLYSLAFFPLYSAQLFFTDQEVVALFEKQLKKIDKKNFKITDAYKQVEVRLQNTDFFDLLNILNYAEYALTILYNAHKTIGIPIATQLAWTTKILYITETKISAIKKSLTINKENKYTIHLIKKIYKQIYEHYLILLGE
ncbi:MAG TPA: hypothetical protein VGW78_03625 [Candidatus Babeliales bacterium]|nr:hypothetical protein [Candidatus Babeliales bacterium]